MNGDVKIQANRQNYCQDSTTSSPHQCVNGGALHHGEMLTV